MEARQPHTLIDYYTHKCLAIKGARRISAIWVIETLADVMLFENIPNYIRSDNGPEMVARFCANRCQDWAHDTILKLFIILSQFIAGKWLV